MFQSVGNALGPRCEGHALFCNLTQAGVAGHGQEALATVKFLLHFGSVHGRSHTILNFDKN